MHSGFIPSRPALERLCLAVLVEAADSIEAAKDEAAFLDALDGNHRIWLAVREASAMNDWAMPSSHDAEFVIQHSSSRVNGISDAEVEAIITINRRVAEHLADGDDMAGILNSIRLIYREGGGGGYIPWMLGQIYKKGRLRSAFDPTSEHGRLHPAIRAAALRFARNAERWDTGMSGMHHDQRPMGKAIPLSAERRN